MKSFILCVFTLLTSLSVYATDNIRTILLKNATPYLFTLEDKSTNEKWSVSRNSYQKIVLYTHLPSTISPPLLEQVTEDDQADIVGDIPFPHDLDIYYRNNGHTHQIATCVKTFPMSDSIIQVFMGNSGMHCVVSSYLPN